MNLTAFSLSASSNPQVDEIQIPFRTVDFQPHQSSFAQVFESMDQDMDLTIGSLNFHVGSLGSIRLSDPTKPDSSASEPETVAMLESSEGSSSEVNSPVSLREAEEGKIAGGDETMENFGLEVQLEDLMICHDDTPDQSTDTWKMGLELSEDDNSVFSSHNSKLDNQYQILAITGDNLEELDDNNNNPVLNPANINRGANHLAEGETADSLTTRAKVRLSANEWRGIKTAVEHGTPIPTNSSQTMLLGYHYALRQQAKQLEKEKIEIQKRKDSAIAASDAARRARNDASYTNRRHHRHGSRYENLEYSERQSISKNLDSSFLSVDEQGNIIPKTPEAALVAAQAYLHTRRPNPGDPREHMH
jgi:hypothetical protein